MTGSAFQAIDTRTEPERPRLTGIRAVRKIVKELVPQARECVIYQLPGFEYKGNLFCYAEFPDHLSLLYPFSEAFWEAFRPDLASYETSSLVVQIPSSREFPEELIRNVVAFRKMENEKLLTNIQNHEK